MWTIYKKLNVSPNSYPLVIPIKQYSSDFILKIKLYSTDGDLDIEVGATTKIRGTKRDGNGFELTGTRIGNTCTFSGTKAQMQQMTAAHGRCVFEIVVENNTRELITANFYLEVQRAAMDAGTVTSESIIEEFADFQSKITAAQAAAEAAQAQADRAEAAAESIDFGLDQVPTQGSTNAVSSGGVYTELDAVPRENLIPYPYSSGSADEPPMIRNGVTFTVNDDGSLTIDGTATADVTFNFAGSGNKKPIKAGTYTISGLTNGSTSTYRFSAVVKNSADTSTLVSKVCTTEPATFTISEDGLLQTYIQVKSGTVIDNLTISPMLEKGAKAHEFVTPAKSTDVEIAKLNTTIEDVSADALTNTKEIKKEVYKESDISTTFVCGTINETTGGDSGTKYAIRSGYISGKAGDTILVSTPEGYKANVYFYNGNTYIADSRIKIFEKTLFIELPENTTQWRINFYKYTDYKYGVDNTNNVEEVLSHLTLRKLTANAYNGFVGLFKFYPTITRSGENYNVSIAGHTRVSWSGGHVVGTTSHVQTETLSNARVLLYLKDSDTFVCVDITQVDAYNNSIPLLGNFKGALYGPWAIYYFNDSDDDNQSLIPTYYYENGYLDNKKQEIRDIALNLGKHSGRFFFVTDYHITNNTRISPLLIAELGAKTGINKTVFGGDALQSYTTAQAAFRGLSDFIADFSVIRDKQDIFYITGNHEYNNPSANPDYTSRMIPNGTIYRLFNDQTPINETVQLNDPHNSFYVDDLSAQIRYYFIGCGYDSKIDIETRRAFGTSLEDTPDGWSVLVISHTGIAYNSSEQLDYITERFKNILECGRAMHDAEEVTVIYPTNLVVGTYDYSGKNRKFLGAIIGHGHWDSVQVYDSRFPVIMTTCDAYGVVPSGHPRPDRVAGTIHEQAFDVVQFDADAGYIYLTRIGDGDDRTVKCWNDAGLVE